MKKEINKMIKNTIKELALGLAVFFTTRCIAQEYLADSVYEFFRNGGF